ncbi:MAG TPA: DUF6600 domain-containing protein [Terriglobales bacterium]|jgi:hypothetical protein|nr:DUF6600 domain-containing protein [Terriglobales bacterium]
MQTFRRFAFGTIAAWLFTASCAVMAFADDPPSRVARLKYISGEVSMQPGGVDDWAAAAINRPMTTADRLWTDKDSRAELHLGSAAMRMDSETSLTLTNLSDNTVQLELAQGTLNMHVSRLYDQEIYEIDTPNTAFTLLKPGDYRFDVDSNGDVTLVTVWKGKGIATGSGDAVRVDSNRQVRFFGGISLAHQSFNAPRLDGFDEWCRVRSSREGRYVSARYVSPDVVGYEDLDDYGAWREVGSYGGVWFPTRVEASWAPYRYGHWAWIEPWGWTWIDDAAWGFAPFHYGRWVFVTGRWGWVPGPVRVRPCYAPALVAWIGGTGVGVSTGWFPLGWGEPYIPYYRVSRNYFNTVNVSNTRITNITYVTNTYYNVNNVRINNIRYVNQTTATTIVNNNVIINSQRIDHNVYINNSHDHYNSHDRWVTSGPACPPSHDSVLGGRRDDHVPPARIMNKRVVMKLPPPERPVPFESKRADLEDRHGRPLDRDEEDRVRRRIAAGHDDRDDHGRSVSDGGRNYPGPKQRDENPGNHNGDRADNHGNPNRGTDRDDAKHNDDSSARQQDPRQPHRQDGRDDDHGQSASSSGNYPGPKQRDQNPRGNDGDQANGRDSQHGNGVAEGRFPRPPRRNNDDGNNDHGQSNSGSAYNPAPKQRDQNPDASGDRAGNNNGQRNAPDSQGNQGDDRSARWRVLRPPRGNDGGNGNNNASNNASNNGNNSASDNHSQPASAGNNNPAPKQREENPSVNDGERSSNGRGWQRNNPTPEPAQRDDASNGRQIPRPPSRNDNGNNNANNSANDNRGQSPSTGSYSPAPRQRDQNPRGNDGERSSPQIDAMRDRRPSPAAERPTPTPSPSNSDRGAGSPPPQQDHTMMRQAQVDRGNSDSHPSQPAPRQAEAQRAPESARAPQPESRPAPSKDSGSNGNSKGSSQYQDRGHGKDHDPDPK